MPSRDPASPAKGRGAGRPRRLRAAVAFATLVPTWIVVLVVYVGTMLWSVQLSVTNSRMLPSSTYVGFEQYRKLFATTRWLISLQNLVIFGVLFIAGCIVVGTLLAIALDRKIRFENAFRTVFLYPYAMSFIVTGLVWQWLMNPELGIQTTMRSLGWTSFTFDWIVNRDLAIYAVVLAGLWQASGLVMVLMLAGLRGVDGEIWRAARVDGIPTWRIYASIVLPQLGPALATAVTLLAMGVVKTYDLVVALTNGGPGSSSEVPAKFIMDNLFGRQNLGLATAASTIMLITVLAILAPYAYAQSMRARRARGGV
ncbi:carbohydrate ABC transporter permease [Kaistia algarum]|uniref:carbohydrate ABC transporter permease n=1 Tax=Kaistia algarum TaxID=2083279 RepID=UPI0038990EC7